MLIHRTPTLSSVDGFYVDAASMDVGLQRPAPAIVVTSPLDLHFNDDDEEVTDSSPPTPRYNSDRECVTQREVVKSDQRPAQSSTWMDGQGTQTSESECQTQSEGSPDPSYAMPLDDDFMSLPRRPNGHSSSVAGSDPHIVAILRDAESPQQARQSPVRAQSPTRPQLTHYSSADEILQRFSEKWKKYQEMTGDANDGGKSTTTSLDDEMPGRRRIPTSQSTKQQKRPSELELLRQENSNLKKRLKENEEFYNEKIVTITTTLDEGKIMWEKTNKENIELRSRADVDSLKMQRMEERIRMLENAMRQSPGTPDDQNNPALWNETSLRRVVDMQEKELSVLRKEVEVFQNRQRGPHFEQNGWRPQQEEPSPSNAYSRVPMYTMGGIVCEDRLPKQYRSTGDLRGAPGVPNASSTLPRPSTLGRESPGVTNYSSTLPRSSSVGRERNTGENRSYGYDPVTTSPVNVQNKIYWIDDPPMEEPPRRSPSHPEPTFEPPKVHPMIVKMATKRKRQERSKTIGLGDLQRNRSNDRAPRDTRPSNDDRSKPWIQRVLNKRKGPGDEDPRQVVDKPPMGLERPPSRQGDQRRVNVYCLGRRVRENSGGGSDDVEQMIERRSPEPEMRPPSREGKRDDDRPPTSVLIESIRQRVREFNMATAPEPSRDHGPADGRRSAEIDRRREESPQRVTRPASSMELGHHARTREYHNPLMDDMRFENDENAEDAALKHRVHNILDRRAVRTPTEEQPLRPPSHGPVRALHSWGSNADEVEEERWNEEKPQVPPLDLSKLKPEKIAQGTGLPTDMRNYADELIKKYMSSLAAANGE